ncbi:VOC family protein [Williamsia sp.]|uniref:VOC family protein n=1 Tax=Williamsia sp. TaxID=1872085 RepID=UPI001A2D0940|nr:VOC family protein [Williamsia sp.]MBJ7289842.1 VOC family protein [Williamsia sp.]
MTTTTNVIGLSVVVSDMARALAFYRALGIEVPAGQDDQPHAEAVLDGGFRLMFDTVDVITSFDPTWTAPGGGHRAALAVDCTDPAGVDTLYATLVAAGHAGHLAPFDAVWGQRYAVIDDPDGNPVDLCAPLA